MTLFEKQKQAAIVALAAQANLIFELIDLVRGLKGIKEPDKYGIQYRTDEWISAIERNSFASAEQFIRAHGDVVPSPSLSRN